MPVSHMAIRYFVNQYKGFRSHNKDNWTPLDFLRWLHQQGRENLAWIVKLYVTLTARVLGYAQRTRACDRDALREVHERALAQLAAEAAMPLETLRRVDALRNAPVTRSMGRTLQLVGADRALLTLAWVALAFAAWVIPLSPTWTLAAWAGCGLGLWLSHALLPWARDRYLGGRVTTQVSPKVDAAAAALAQVLDVRYIVFGHTHKPRKVRVRADPPCDYLNSGSWLAPRGRERHEANQPCPSRLTFIVCRDGAALDARLFRWCTRDSAPIPFDPRVGLEGLEPEHPDDLAPTVARLRDRPGPLRGRRPDADRRADPRRPR
jgi:type IV secretory pathway TrbD component